MQVIYGREAVEMDSETVEVRAVHARLRSFMGIPRDAVAFVDGIKVGQEHLVQPTSTVEFRVERGHKGVGQIWTAEQYCQLFGLKRTEFENQIERGLKVMETGNGMMVTETAVDSFIAGLNGDGAYLAVIASSLKRLADHVDPPPPDIIGTDYIAEKLGCTLEWIAKMAMRGDIPRNCVVPGTGNGKPWKFYRSRIDPWILMR
jgi:hypothetical protein